MNDRFNKPRDLDHLWEILANNARMTRADSEDNDYFLGIFEGCMSALAMLSVYIGRMEDYSSLCFELDDICWEAPVDN